MEEETGGRHKVHGLMCNKTCFWLYSDKWSNMRRLRSNSWKDFSECLVKNEWESSMWKYLFIDFDTPACMMKSPWIFCNSSIARWTLCFCFRVNRVWLRSFTHFNTAHMNTWEFHLVTLFALMITILIHAVGGLGFVVWFWRHSWDKLNWGHTHTGQVWTFWSSIYIDYHSCCGLDYCQWKIHKIVYPAPYCLGSV